jgi:drug/metabolite transporter (DMT)-like permease
LPRALANLLLLAAGAIWGMGFVAQSTAMESVGPILFVALRFALATVAMLPFAIAESRRAPRPLTRREMAGFAGIGLLLTGGMLVQQIGMLTTTVTNAGFLTGLYVVFVPFVAVMLFRERPHAAIWPGAALAFGGIFLLSGGELGALTAGDWLNVLCAVFWAFQVFLIGRYAAGTGRPVTLAVTQFAVCFGVAGVLAALLEPFPLDGVMAAMPEILFAGIVSGGIAFTLQVIGQRWTTAPQAAIFLSTEAVFAALFAALILGERLPATGLLGCALILAAILVVELAPSLMRRRLPAGRVTP